jgi:curved DNA-binding protein CbpA
LFCFRSCLKGENDREYYDILEIDNPNLATTDYIKKQYKKLSLSVHPVRGLLTARLYNN